MTDQKKPETVADEDLETAQGGLYSTSAAGTELFSTDAGTMELMTTDATTLEAKRRLKKDGDGFIAFGNETGL